MSTHSVRTPPLQWNPISHSSQIRSCTYQPGLQVQCSTNELPCIDVELEWHGVMIAPPGQYEPGVQISHNMSLFFTYPGLHTQSLIELLPVGDNACCGHWLKTPPLQTSPSSHIRQRPSVVPVYPPIHVQFVLTELPEGELE